MSRVDRRRADTRGADMSRVDRRRAYVSRVDMSRVGGYSLDTCLSRSRSRVA